MDSDLLHQIREAVNQESILGSSYFREKIEEVLGRHVNPTRAGASRVEEFGEAYEVRY